MQSGKKLRIGVFGHYGNVNLGDEASFAATVDNIRRRVPEAIITGFTLYPGSTQEHHGVPAYPIRRGYREYGWTIGEKSSAGEGLQRGGSGVRAAVRDVLRKIPPLHATARFVRGCVAGIRDGVAEIGFFSSCFLRLRRIDVLWIAGSNQIEDAHGAWGYPYTLYKWTWLSRLTGTKVLFVGVGASPMRTGASRFFCRGALKRAAYRSFRSVNSKKVVEQLGVGGVNELCPDLAYSLASDVKPSGASSGDGPLLIAINPMGYFDRRYWPVADDLKYHEYVEKLAQFALEILKGGYRVTFFPTQLASDPPVIEDIIATMEKREAGSPKKLAKTNRVEWVDDLLNLIRTAGVTIVTRFHGVVLSHVMHKPVIALSYEQKIDDEMAAVGHSEYCLPIGTFTVPELMRTLERLVAEREKVSAELSAKVSPYQRDLDRQYDRLLEIT